jgi:hypothetical protein
MATANPTKTVLYLGASLFSMYAGSMFVQSIIRTDMSLTKEIEIARAKRKLEKQKQQEEEEEMRRRKAPVATKETNVKQ